MIEMETGEDARPVNLVQPVPSIFERMRVDAIGQSRLHHHVYFVRSEVVRNQMRNGACDAAVRSGILGMAGRGTQGHPGGIGLKFGVTASSRYRRDRPPETIGVFGVETAD